MKNIIFFGVLFLIGCQPGTGYQDSQLVGNWKGIEWNDLTNNKKIDVKVGFTFEEGNRYTGNYGNSSESGKYWIAGDNLHTIEDGKAEKKVKIKKLLNDTLIFGMNRSGVIEEIVLIKEN